MRTTCSNDAPALCERGFDELEAGAGLVGGGEVVGADGAGAGDVDDVADADGAREANDGLVGRCTGDVGAGHGVDVNQVCGGSLWRAEDGEIHWGRAMARRGSIRSGGWVDGAGGGDGRAEGGAGTGPTAQNQTATAAESQQDLGATQQRLMQLLRVSPTLAEVVSSDPSLLADQQYVAKSNPELAAFLAAASGDWAQSFVLAVLGAAEPAAEALRGVGAEAGLHSDERHEE